MDYESTALTIELPSRLPGKNYNLHSSSSELGAGDRNRTCDKLSGSQLLYQLSYTRKPASSAPVLQLPGKGRLRG